MVGPNNSRCVYKESCSWFLSVLVGFMCDDTSGRCVCSCVSFTVNIVIEIVSVMMLLRNGVMVN